MQEAVVTLFERYQDLFNRALAGTAGPDEVVGLYADAFISATPAGVATGANDESLKSAIAGAFEYYRAIRTRRMTVAGVRVEPIDPSHALAFVDWVATYDKQGSDIEIPFTNAYFVRLQDGVPKVFGWVTGDEQAELRRHGIG